MVAFAKAILEDDDLFVMTAGSSFHIDGWVEGLPQETVDQLMKYRQDFIDSKVVQGEVEDGGVQSTGLRQ